MRPCGPAVVATLVVDAVVHWRLATGYGWHSPRDRVTRRSASRRNTAVMVAVWVGVTGSRTAWASAFLLLAWALVAVVLDRYVPVPQLGRSRRCTSRSGSRRRPCRRSPRA